MAARCNAGRGTVFYMTYAVTHSIRISVRGHLACCVIPPPCIGSKLSQLSRRSLSLRRHESKRERRAHRRLGLVQAHRTFGEAPARARARARAQTHTHTHTQRERERHESTARVGSTHRGSVSLQMQVGLRREAHRAAQAQRIAAAHAPK